MTEKIKSGRSALKIINEGSYQFKEKIINIKSLIEDSVNQTTLYTPNSFTKLAQEVESKNKNFSTNISVLNCTTQEAIESIINDKEKTGCLNFASAKNPGGGFLGNAQAQEESLARASSLYPSLIKYFKEMYEYNRGRRTYLYSDYMIYSPNVVFFKNSKEELLEVPYLVDILTSPAVNIGAMQKNKPEELEQAATVMIERMDKMLSVFAEQKVDNLILGAWGCGVFRNKAEDIAKYFAHYLLGKGKYSQSFKKIIFAIYDRSKSQENIKAFQKIILN